MSRTTWSAVAGLVVLAVGIPLPARDWPRFRGPNGSGVGEATLPLKWTGKDQLWKVTVPGVGHSSPVIWEERVFVTSGDEDGKRFLLCYSTRDGKRLWLREFEGHKHGRHKDNSFASATPAVDERHVYVLWASPKDMLVAAFDHDGKEKWRADLGTYRSGHGSGASPIVHDDMVIVPNDQDAKGSLVALDGESGKVRWTVPRKGKATYTTPCVYQPKSGPAELLFANYEHGITSVDPKSGKVNWEIDLFDKRHVETSIGSPIVAGDMVLAMSGWLGVRQEVVAVKPNGGKPKEVYRITRSAPLCTTPLVVDDMLFLWTDGGMVSCADLASGEVHWRERVPGSYYSSPISNGKYVLNVSREGDVVILAVAKNFVQLGKNSVGEGTHSTPALAGGRLYVRTFSHLICIGR